MLTVPDGCQTGWSNCEQGESQAVSIRTISQGEQARNRGSRRQRAGHELAAKGKAATRRLRPQPAMKKTVGWNCSRRPESRRGEYACGCHEFEPNFCEMVRSTSRRTLYPGRITAFRQPTDQ